MGKPYNGTCDTYSFCLLLWQMLALSTPYELYTIKKLKERVWSDMEKRPLVNENWSANIKLLLKKGWANDHKVRFQMSQVEGILKKECIRVRDGDSNGLEHQRRRSTFVFRGNDAGKKGGDIRSEILQKANAENKSSKTTETMKDLSTRSDHVTDNSLNIRSEHTPRGRAPIPRVKEYKDAANVVSCDV